MTWAVDKIVKVKEVLMIEQENVGADVVLKLTCKAGGKRVRLVIPVGPYAIEDVVKALRKGTCEQLGQWERVKNVIGDYR